jgi:hypothetical protein
MFEENPENNLLERSCRIGKVWGKKAIKEQRKAGLSEIEVPSNYRDITYK